MAKTLTEARIAGRTERKRLAEGIYWRGIDPDVHLGYRKGKRGGVWLVRWYLGGGYRQRKLGTADDEFSQGTLDYSQAVRTAREVVEAKRLQAKVTAQGPVLTVADAIVAYVAVRDARESARRGRQIASDARGRLSRYVSGKAASGQRKEIASAALARVPLHSLSDRDLLKWRDELPASLKSTTKRRLINDLKAALNAAYAANRDCLPNSFSETVKHGLRTLDQPTDAPEEVAGKPDTGR